MIIARYLLKEIGQTLFAVGLVLMLVALSGQLVTIFNEVAAGRLGVNTVMMVLGLQSLSMMMIVLPLSLFLAVLMTLSRLYQSNEMAAIFASGISPHYVLKVVVGFAVLFSIVVGIFSLQIIPSANHLQLSILNQSSTSNRLEGVQEGRFREIAAGGGVIYVEGMNETRTEMQGVFVQQKVADNVETIIRAQKGHHQIDPKSGQRFLIFEEGVRYQHTPGKQDYTVIRFQQHGVRIKNPKRNGLTREYMAVPTMALLEKQPMRYRAEFHSRMSPIFLSILLAALAVPLSQTSPRQGRYLRLGMGLVIYIVFTNLISIGISWIKQGKMPDFFGLWWVYLLMLILLAVLLLQQTGFRYLLARKQQA